MLNRYAYTLIAGQGLGTAYSSLAQGIPILSSEGFGQAKIHVYANLANGNVAIKDHVVNIVEGGEPLEIFYAYNSKADKRENAWRLAVADRFTQLPSTTDPLGTMATLVEVDGHITTYTQHPTYKTLYFAPGSTDDTPYLQYDYPNKRWIKYHPGTKVSDYYDTQGYLISRVDAAGHTLEFMYGDAAAGQERPLQAVMRPGSNTRYEFRRQGSTVSIYSVVSGRDTLLQIHQLDLKSKKTIIPSPDKPVTDWYTITYNYNDGSTFISDISQTDGTRMSFVYSDGSQVSVIYVGEEPPSSNATRITYEKKSSAVTVEDGSYAKTKVVLDGQNRISQITRQQGYETDTEITKYQYATKNPYTDGGQLACITHADASKEIFEHNNFYGMLTKRTQPDGQITEYYYDRGDLPESKHEFKDDAGRKPNRIVEARYPYDKAKPLVTRYIYDNNYDQQGNRFLRFVITPSGCITEYRPNLNGNIASKRTYLSEPFNLSAYPINLTPSLFAMLDWVKTQDPQQITLTDYLYDTHSQVSRKRVYNIIKPDGSGDDKAIGMGEEELFWSNHGDLEKLTVKYDEKATSEIESTYDTLSRVTRTRKKINETQEEITSYNYLDAKQQIQITRPNGRIELQQLNTLGIVASEQATVISDSKLQETRLTRYEREPGGLPVVTTGPDQRKTITFYDAKQRVAFSISATGLVTEYQYDDVHRYRATVRYATPVSFKEFYPPGILPSFDAFRLLALKKDPVNDRINYTFFDASERIRFKIDENLAVVEFFYDALNRLAGKVAYESPLTDAQLIQLKAGKHVDLPLDLTKDRDWRCSYDDDSNLVSERDSAGYVTKYIRDVAGRIVEKIAYDKPTSIIPEAKSFDAFDCQSTDKDAHTYYYYDARNQCIAEVDAENYYTAYSYFANGLKASHMRYANRVTDPKWLEDKSHFPPVPPLSTEDQITDFHYDLLQRTIGVDAPSDKSSLTHHDEMGHVTATKVVDMSMPRSTSPDSQRGTEIHYDGWEQVTQEANVFIRQLLTEIDADEKKTPGQKEAAKKEVWEKHSLRHTYEATGLKLKTTDPLDNITYYYYDKERRPIFIIDPTGAVHQNSFNTFNELVETRDYTTRLTPEIVASLTGGLLPDNLSKQLDALKNSNDPITKFTPDKLGLITETVDPAGYVFKKSYNAFRECNVEIKPRDEKSSITVTHKREVRGLEIETTQQAGGQTITESRKFTNPFGKETSSTDACGSTTTTEYDRLARPCKITDPADKSHTFKHDSFDRLTSETDSLTKTTTHTYIQHERTHTIIAPVASVITMTRANVFGEMIESVNALDKSETFEHAPDGQITLYQNALKQQTSDKYDLTGQHSFHTDAVGFITRFTRDAAGNVITETVFSDEKSTFKELKLNLKTVYVRDALGRAITVTDPRGVLRETTFDRCSRPLTTTTDPTSKERVGLDLVTQASYNALSAKTSLTRGDAKQLDQSYITLQYDAFNRSLGKTIDPDSLAITTSSRLNARGQEIVQIDPKGHITRLFYDKTGRLRFTLNPLGSVSEVVYNSEGQITAKRIYEQPINVNQLTDDTSIEMIEKWAEEYKSQFDTLTISIRDAISRECFTITQLGAVTEKRYDTASNEVQTIYYYAAMLRSDMLDLTYEKMLAWAKDMANPGKDRVINRIFDDEGNERFTIDEENYIKEKCYDALMRVICETTYANKIEKREFIATLPPEKVLDQLSLDAARDCTTYTIFDLHGKPWFVVTPTGESNPQYAVTRHDHDENGNLIFTCQFANPITQPASYEALIATVKALTPNLEKDDRILKHQYDNANRTKTITDAIGNSDSYIVDALGNIRYHTDRAGATWEYRHDRAERLILEIAPTTTVTHVTVNPDTSKKLIYTKSQMAVQKCNVYDKAGNKEKIIEADGTPEARVIKFNYNNCNKLIGTEIPDIAVYDEKQHPSLDTRPEKIITVKTTITLNAKQLPVAIQNESGYWTFVIYNPENKAVYQVDALGSVIKNEYDTCGDLSKEIRYSNRLELDLSQYTQTGIPITVLEQHLKISADDRITIYLRDKRGDWISKQLGQEGLDDSLVFYYIPNEDGTGECKKSIMKSTAVYDANRKLISQSILIDSSKNVYSESVWWRDRTGEIIAESRDVSNPLSSEEKERMAHHIKRYHRNVFKEEFKRIEYAQALTLPPDKSIKELSLTEIDQHFAGTTSRTFLTEHDKLGQKITETRVGIVFQSVELDEKSGIPSCKDLDAQNVVKIYEYSAIQQLTAVVDWQGISTGDSSGVKRFYHDSRGLKIAEADVPRQSLEENDQPITLIPLTYFGVNAHGQPVSTTRFKKGTLEAKPDILPTPLLDAAEDQIDLTLFDARGLPIIKQDAEDSITDYIYMPIRKIASQQWRLTNFEIALQTDSKAMLSTTPVGLESKRSATPKPKNQIIKRKHLDEKRFTYDECDRPTAIAVYRDDALIETTATGYNTFGQSVCEGPGDGNWPVYRRYNAAGWLWSTNADGINTIILHDLAGHETARLQSTATQETTARDLSQITYSQLSSLMNWSPIELERTQTIRDHAGRGYKKLRPQFYQTLMNTTAPIGITMHVISDLITWQQPAEKTYSTPIFKISPEPQGEAEEIKINLEDGRYHCKVKAKPSGIYRYQIDYKLENPFTHETIGEAIYTSSGEVQLDTGITQGSTSIAAIMKSNTELRLIGKVEGLTTIQLYQYDADEKVADPIPVTLDAKSGERLADLKDQRSGIYRAKPIMSDGTHMTTSLPFTVYSKLPSVKPLSREIIYDVQLKILHEYGNINWPTKFKSLSHPIKISCEYLDDDDIPQIYETEVTMDTSFGHFEDEKGDILNANIKFDYKVKTITSLTLFLKLGDEWIMILNKAKDIKTGPQKLKIARKTKETKSSKEDDDYIFVSTPTSNIIETYDYGSRDILYIAPLSGFDKSPTLKYKDSSMGSRSAEWKNIACIDTTPNGVVLEVTNMFPGWYQYAVEAKSGPQKGIFYVVGKESGILYPSEENIAPPPSLSLSPVSTRTYTHDAWDNVIKEKDAFDFMTTSTYTDLHHLDSKTLPSIWTINENGIAEAIATTTHYASNARGEGIGTKDDYDHSTIIIRDAAGQSIMEVLADGSLERKQVYDALRRVTRYCDDGRTDKLRWNYQWFDRLNRIIRSRSPKGKEATYTYTELGSRNSEGDLIGTQIYSYNALGLIEARHEPSGDCHTSMQYYPNSHQLKAQYNPDGTSLSWVRDYFGHITKHWDLSNAEFTYTYDHKWQIIKQTSKDGPTRNYMRVTKNTVVEVIGRTPVMFDGYVPNSTHVPGQNLTFTYQAGCLVTVNDDAHKKETNYSYDKEFRRISTEVYLVESGEARTLIRKATTTLNAWGLPEAMFDTDMALYTNYDQVGNRRHVTSFLYTEQTPVQQSSLWMRYNPANQVIIDNGELTPSRIIQPGQGTAFEYIDTNGRPCKLRTKETKNGVPTILEYDDDGVLIGSHTPDRSSYTESKFDPLGQEYPYGYTYRESQNGVVSEHQAKFDINRWQRYEVQKSGEKSTETKFTPTPIGLTGTQDSSYPDGISDHLTYEYMHDGDTAQLAKISGRRRNKFGDGDYSSAEQLYDANGVINAQLGVDDYKGGQQPVVCFDATYDGIVMRKMRMFRYPSTFFTPSPLSSLVVDERIFTGVNGEYLGSYTVTRDIGKADYRSSLDYTTRMSARLGGGREVSYAGTSQSRGAHYDMLSSSIINKGASPSQMALTSEIVNLMAPHASRSMSLADVIQPANKSPLPSQYIVVEGDTFENIARKMGRNAEFASAIAAANHMVVTQPPTPGQKLQMPFFIDSHSTGKDYLAYGLAIQRLISGFYPHLEMHQPPQPPHKHQSWFHELMETVVSVVVFIVALPVTGPIGASILSNIAAQGTAMALGDQHGFSFKSLAISTVEAVIASRMPLPNISGKEFTDQLIKKGMVAMTDQLVEIGAGLRKDFDLNSIAAMIATQAASIGMETKGKNLFSTSEQTFSNSLLASALHSAVTNTPLKLEFIAAQALGTTIGAQLGQSSLDFLSTHNAAISSYMKAQAQPSPSTRSLSSHEQAASRSADEPQYLSAKPPAPGKRQLSLEEMLKAEEIAKRMLPDVTLDLSDPRKATSQAETKAVGHSYLLESDRQVRYKSMFFGRGQSQPYVMSQTFMQQPGFFNALGDSITKAYKSSANWSAASIDKLSELTKHISWEYKAASLQRTTYARQALNVQLGDTLAAEAGSDIGMSIAKTENSLAYEFQRSSNQLSRFSMFAKGGVIGLDVINKGIDVVHTPPGQRARVGFVKSAELVGEGLGIFAGDFLVGLFAIPSAGTSLVVTPLVTVGAAASGGYLFGHSAEWLEDKYDSITQKWRS